MVGNHDAVQAEKRRGPHDGAEIVRVADAVQQKQRLALGRPALRLRRVEGGDRTKAGHRDDSAMQHRAGYPRQFFGIDLTVGFAGLSKLAAETGDGGGIAFVEEQPFDQTSVALEQGLDGGEAGDPQHLGSGFGCPIHQLRLFPAGPGTLGGRARTRRGWAGAFRGRTRTLRGQARIFGGRARI